MTQPRYAAITLGSNSFNMLVAQTECGQPQVVAKYKRKVRLAEGIDSTGALNGIVMQRGLDCLSMFANMLNKEQVSIDDVAIIATATLRKITNADVFCQRALDILAQPIQIISGLEEAELIYQGMDATTPGQGRRLVIDIGGASTEFIIGDGSKVLLKHSLPMGCVLFNGQFFKRDTYIEADFNCAIEQVKTLLADIQPTLLDLGWQSAVGASGCVQTLTELLRFRGEPTDITYKVLLKLKHEVLNLNGKSLQNIQGLSTERSPTFVAGLAILIALFEQLSIDKLVLSGGALREGVLYQLLTRQSC